MALPHPDYRDLTVEPLPSGHNRHILGLDLLRFGAAVLVLAFHLGFFIWNGAARVRSGIVVPVSYEWLGRFTNFGWIGVQIFFVLSGFVIAYSADYSGPGAFLRSRIVRLAPAAWICASLTAAVLLVWPAPSTLTSEVAIRWLKSVLFSPVGPWIDGSYWTLAIEVAFYGLVFLLLALRLNRLNPVVIGAVGLFSSLFWMVWTITAAAPSPGENRIAALLLLYHGCLFATGVFLWLCLLKRATAVRLVVLALCIVGSLLQITADSEGHALEAGIRYSATVPIVIWLFGLVVLVVVVAADPWMRRCLGKSRGLVRNLGRVTYPWYLLHQTLGSRVILWLHGIVPDTSALAIAAFGTLALAWVIATRVEPVVQQGLRLTLSRVMRARWIDGPSVQPQQSTPRA